MERSGKDLKNCKLSCLITIPNSFLFCPLILYRLDKQPSVSLSLLYVVMVMWQRSGQCDIGLSLFRHCQETFAPWNIYYLTSTLFYLFQYRYNGAGASAAISLPWEEMQESHKDFSNNVIETAETCQQKLPPDFMKQNLNYTHLSHTFSYYLQKK